MKKFLCITLVPLLISGCSIFSKDEVKQEVPNPNYKISVEQDNSGTEKVLDIMNCPITPEIESNVTAPQIYKTNNLRKKTGYASFAKGNFIRISGIITDNFCVPVKNATVQIWQADANGRYKSIPNDGYLNDSMMYRRQNERFEEIINNDMADENFTGSGSTITDNLGRFVFFSVMPGGAKPLVNFRVIHKDFNDTKTVMYFDVGNGVSPLLVARNVGQVQYDEVQEAFYEYKITLNGKNKYSSY